MPSLAEVTSSQPRLRVLRAPGFPCFLSSQGTCAVQTSGHICAARTLTRICGRIRTCHRPHRVSPSANPTKQSISIGAARWIASLRAMTVHFELAITAGPAHARQSFTRRRRPGPCRSQRAARHRRLQDRRSQADLLGAAYALAAMAGAAASRRRPYRRDRRHRQCARHQHKTRTETVGGLASRKPELTRAGSMGRSASSMRSKPPASSIRIRTSKAPSKSQRGATRKAISAVSSAAGPMSARHRGRHRRRARPQQRSNHARRPARGRPCRPAARHGRTRAAYRISRGAYRARPDARKRRPQRSASSPPSSASGNTASPLRASKIMPARRGWPFAGMPAWRWRDFASISTIGFPRIMRTAHGMDHRPHHARSRRAEHHPRGCRNAVPDARR